ncbi:MULTISPECIES: ead/Ea22-like family protein [Enterobacteriaceae]|uniref:ead/Ea22-like family protein n=1 Tax=Enterobacteriaceae TaxID=543 RepID=UPI0019266DBF|nr:ead/Ea22-like family protein [Citrobacter freundii]EEE1738630.1 ead/Ea22-like family protein [Salmonella enterica subsp. enterica serovar Johannesburg]CAD5353641.1 Ead/Ea22-like family protein [Citrobacter freundii]CAD5355219.1 Ead/Ea22-like family protein [Citrobacter freundii]
MTALNKRALRKAAMHAKTEDDWGCDADNFHDKATPDAVLSLLDELEAAEKRIAELEAGTVVVKQFDDFQIVHYGGSEDYAKGYIDCQNNYNKALTAAGIGVKGE